MSCFTSYSRATRLLTASGLRSAAFDELLRIIREEEPPKPSQRLSTVETLPSIAASRHITPAELTRQLSGELDWIVMKTLEKDRSRRYDTANGLAERPSELPERRTGPGLSAIVGLPLQEVCAAK